MPDPREIRVARMAVHATMEHLRPQLRSNFTFNAAELCRIADEAQALIIASDERHGHAQVIVGDPTYALSANDGLDFGDERWTPGHGIESTPPPTGYTPPPFITTTSA